MTVLPPPAPSNFIDEIYGTKFGVELPLRIWPTTVNDGVAAPWLMWIHGGGWTEGSHFNPNPWFIRAFRPRGYHIVSISYRLIPHVSISDQIEDGIDALKWCRENLPRILGKDKVNIDNYAVAGESAGGHLTLMMGHVLQPQPKAVCALYPPVDLLNAHIGGPSPTQFSLLASTPEEAEKEISNWNPADALAYSPGLFELSSMDEKTCGELWKYGHDLKFTKTFRQHGDLARYMFSKSLIVHTALRKSSFETDEQWEKHARKYSPLFLLDENPTYPPTYLMHGEQDSWVSVNNSYQIAKRLKEMGIPVQEWYEPGEHVFDIKYMNGEASPGWEAFTLPVMEFMDRYVR